MHRNVNKSFVTLYQAASLADIPYYVSDSARQSTICLLSVVCIHSDTIWRFAEHIIIGIPNDLVIALPT